jgi:hypothetical protein
MTKIEAYRILAKMWKETEDADQAKALDMAMNDIEFVDLMPNDVVAVVRCKDCKYWDKVYECSTDWHGYCHLEDADGIETSRWGDDFCSYGVRRSE